MYSLFASGLMKGGRMESINNYELRHQIKGIIERFELENMSELGEYMKTISNMLITKPEYLEHSEINIPMSINNFITSIANKPLSNVYRNKDFYKEKCQIFLDKLEDLKKCLNNNTDDAKYKINDAELLQSLEEDFIRNVSSSSSDLSEWSESECTENTDEESENDDIVGNFPDKLLRSTPTKHANIKPPERYHCYTVYQGTDRLQHIQDNWWAEDKLILTKTESTSYLANYAILYSQLINEGSSTLEKEKLPSTVLEYCLLREIIFMFFGPTNCKFFNLDQNNIIQLNNNVTINSVSKEQLHLYLEHMILKPLRIMHELRAILDLYENMEATLACFRINVGKLLNDIINKLLNYERHLIDQNNIYINSLIYFSHYMRQSFSKLDFLYGIVMSTKITNINEAPAHLRTMYLLAKLFDHMKIDNNYIIAAIFVNTLKVYCTIIDTWWTRGILNDPKREFVVERANNSADIILRKLDAEPKINSLIKNCPIYNIFCENALLSGKTQTVLSEFKDYDELINNYRIANDKPLHDEIINYIIDSTKPYVSTMQHQDSAETVFGLTNIKCYKEKVKRFEVENKCNPAFDLHKTLPVIESKKNNDTNELISLTETSIEEQFVSAHNSTVFPAACNSSEVIEQQATDKTTNETKIQYQSPQQRELLPVNSTKICSVILNDTTAIKSETDSLWGNEDPSIYLADSLPKYNQSTSDTFENIFTNYFGNNCEPAVTIPVAAAKTKSVGAEEAAESQEIKSQINLQNLNKNESCEKIFEKLTATKDAHLLGAIYANINEKSHLKARYKHEETNSLKNFIDILEKAPAVPTLDQIICNAIKYSLQKRMSLANKHIMRLYNDEINILMHLQHIRNIILMQANHILYNFYEKIFQKIETGCSWKDSVFIAMRFDEIITVHYPDISGLIHIDLKDFKSCKSDKVFEVVQYMHLSYRGSVALSHIITEEHITEYNKIYHQLLKVKWASWKLENMRFPSIYTMKIKNFRKLELYQRRIEQLRMWIYFAIYNLHFYLCSQIEFARDKNFAMKYDKCENINDLKVFHETYLYNLCHQCLVTEDFKDINSIIDQIYYLIYVLNIEWKHCMLFYDDSYNCDVTPPYNPEQNLQNNDSTNYNEDFYCFNKLDELESTYIRFHQLLTKSFRKEIDNHDHDFLRDLEDAFFRNTPY